jgi:hypothetical protein
MSAMAETLESIDFDENSEKSKKKQNLLLEKLKKQY